MDTRSSLGVPRSAPAKGHGGSIPATSNLAVNRVSDSYRVKGSGTVRYLTALPRGTAIWLDIKDAPVFANSAKLLCPSSVDYIGAPGDVALALSQGGGIWRLFVFPAAARARLNTGRFFYVRTAPVPVTISNASPAVASAAAHGLQIDDPVVFNTTGTLPTGVTAGTVYYVIAAGFGGSAFQFSATVGGAAINTSGAGSGTHSFQTGNDNNNGQAATRTGALLNPQKAFDLLGNLDLGASAGVIVQLANGLYLSGVSLTTAWLGSAIVILQGDTATPSNVTINAAAGPINIVDCPVTLYVQGLKLISTGNNLITSIGAGSYVIVNGKMEYGACVASQEYASRGGRIRGSADVGLSGDAQNFFQSSHGGNIRHDAGEIKLLANVNYSAITGFAYVDYGDGVFTGTATINLNGFTANGKRYGEFNRGMIQAAGLSPPAPTFFPGNVPGERIGRTVEPVAIRPAQITANTNNWSPSDASTGVPFYQTGGIYVQSDASRNITGLDSSNIVAGQIINIVNIGSFPVVLKSLNGLSSGPNQFAIAADITLNNLQQTKLQFDAINNFWRPG